MWAKRGMYIHGALETDESSVVTSYIYIGTTYLYVPVCVVVVRCSTNHLDKTKSVIVVVLT